MAEHQQHAGAIEQPRIRFRPRDRALGVPPVLRDAIARDGWLETEGRDFDVLWDWPGPDDDAGPLLRPGRRYNFFGEVVDLVNKCELYRNLCAARAALGERGAEIYDFFPRSYSMPDEFGELRQAAQEAPGALWICKPTAAARGEGLRLIDDVRAAPRGPEWLVQEYIAAPHLIDGHKYSLRVYVLLTSLVPLQGYLFREGLCKPAARPYRCDTAALDDRFIHLTNYAVSSADPEAPGRGRYLTLAGYRQWLREQGHDDAGLWGEIRRVCALTLLAARGSMLQGMQSHGWDPAGCFELMGLDIMLDEARKPWLIECNRSPGLAVYGEDIRAITREFLADTLALVRPGAPAGLGDRARCGGFEPLFAGPELAALASAYTAPRAADLALLRGVMPTAAIEGRRFVAGRLEAAVVDGRQVLFAPETRRFVALSAAGLRVFRAAVDGSVAQEIVAAGPAVWDTLGELLDAGLLRRRDEDVEDVGACVPEPPALEDAASEGPIVTVLAADGERHLSAAIRLRQAFADQARRNNDHRALVEHQTELGNLYYQRGEAMLAYRSYRRALMEVSLAGRSDPSLLMNLAVAAFRAGLLAEADAGFDEVIASGSADGEAPGAELLGARAMVAAARGDAALTERRLAAARAQAAQEGDIAMIGVALCEGESYLLLGDRARAHDVLRRAHVAIGDRGPAEGVDLCGVLVALADCEDEDPARLFEALTVLPRALLDPNAWWHLPRLVRRVLRLAEQGRLVDVTPRQQDELRRLARQASYRCDGEEMAARLGELIDGRERVASPR